MDFSGSPKQKATSSLKVLNEKENTGSGQPVLSRPVSTTPLAAGASILSNKVLKPSDRSPEKYKMIPPQLGPAPAPAPTPVPDDTAVEKLYARLSLQQAAASRQKKIFDDASSSDTDPYAGTAPLGTADERPDSAEVFKLKRELEMAKQRMAEMDVQLAKERDERIALAEMELTQSQLARQTVETAIGSPFPTPTLQHFGFNTNNSSTLNPGATFTPQARLRGENPLVGNFAMRQGTADAFARSASAFNTTSDGFNMVLPQTGYQAPLLSGNVPAFRPQPPIGTRPSTSISPSSESAYAVAPWAGTQQATNYMSITEPLNYRRLLDRNMSCNWKYIVDKIVCSNDQQASIFLQQKLKIGTAEQKFEIVQSIIDQAYPLMVNRFGNFLVQRCFEHGTAEQVVAIAQAIRGNTLTLSMDAFGCHVVQKAFDCVPEEYKAVMVHELLRRIPETVIHRYACHVWQKLFELRWNDTPPQIMKYVNEALRGMWHEVALGETGSLVVQNIFENCLEEDKRPCISEVLANIDMVAHGQFGNWCIQHICEHGAIPDRTRAVDHIIHFASEYSMDQFASKVVEKCLKVAGNDFLDRFLDRVCEARADRPRMPLIDIAGDQFGNYLIQFILTNADKQRREVVAAHIRKHMVSLRGSKYGSRVAMLCSNPAYATRPGPPGGLAATRYNGRFNDNALLGGESGVRGFNADNSAASLARGGYIGNFR